MYEFRVRFTIWVLRLTVLTTLPCFVICIEERIGLKNLFRVLRGKSRNEILLTKIT